MRRRSGLILALLAAAAALGGTAARAHALDGASLAIRDLGGNTFRLELAIPLALRDVPPLAVHLAPQCTRRTEPRHGRGAAHATTSWLERCEDSFSAPGSVTIAGLSPPVAAMLVVFTSVRGETSMDLLTPRRHTAPLGAGRMHRAAAPSLTETFRAGILCVLHGWEHAAIAVGLILLCGRRGHPAPPGAAPASPFRRAGALAAGSFVLALSLALALTASSAIRPAPAAVRVLVAASLVVVGYEASRRGERAASLAVRWPWIAAGAFGFVHGLAAAEVLRASGVSGAVPVSRAVCSGLGLAAGFFAIVEGFAALRAAARYVGGRGVEERLERALALAMGGAGAYCLAYRMSALLVG
ncbi:MAG: HupE/UreJ family protein [Candidatus Schekmanbacteria bacterium]|nr:HupE/UreJ family protein [Candidatus Schekmanbacteria bacterium]